VFTMTHLKSSQQNSDHTGCCTCRPEYSDNFPFTPSKQFEMVEDRCHLEYPFTSEFEGCHLQHYRRRVNDKNRTDERQHQTDIDHNRNNRDHTAEDKRPRISDKELRRGHIIYSASVQHTD